MYFRHYGLPKTRLDKYKKRDVSQYPSNKQHGKRAQILFKSARRTFTIFINHCEGF